MRRRRGPTELGPLQVVGAWLGLWTPPRDAVVPPVPWRRLLLGALAAAAVLGAAAALVVPAIDSSKRSAAERERELGARRAAAERRRLVTVQRPRHARLRQSRASRAGSPTAERRARRALLAAAVASITADARRRTRSGELNGPIRRTSCKPAPASIRRAGAETTLRASSDAYDCLAVTDDIRRGSSNVAGAIGYPFRAVVDFRTGRYTWCRLIPVAGERAVPDPRSVVPPPPACRLRR